MTKERAVVFDCAGDRLIGILHAVESAAQTGVVIVIGGPQYRAGSHRQFVVMARQFSEAGIPVLRFDYRGMGDADGKPRAFDTVDDDIRAAVDCLTTIVPSLNRIVLLGLCDAASANLIYAPFDRRVGALILLNPWVRTEQGEAKAYLKHYYLQRLFQKSFWRKLFTGKFAVSQSVRELIQARRIACRSRSRAIDDNDESQQQFIHRMLVGLTRFDRPVLFVVSGRDLTAKEFMDLCGDDKAWSGAVSRPGVEIQQFPDADHTMSNGSQLRSVSRFCVNWLVRD